MHPVKVCFCHNGKRTPRNDLAVKRGVFFVAFCRFYCAKLIKNQKKCKKNQKKCEKICIYQKKAVPLHRI